jgi:hypothetical protein
VLAFFDMGGMHEPEYRVAGWIRGNEGGGCLKYYRALFPIFSNREQGAYRRRCLICSGLRP